MTAAIAKIGIPSLREKVSPEEWQARVELAACYRLVAHNKWNSALGTHISARVPGEEKCFLLNPVGLMFHEVTASSLIKTDWDGNVLNDTPFRLNPGGHAIHSGVYMARPELVSALHTHTENGMAISVLKCGLMPITQVAMRFHKRVAYHDYFGQAGAMDERERIGADLGPHLVMIMRNHGLLTVGRTIGEAFVIHYVLEAAIAAQLQAMRSGGEIIVPPEEICDQAALNREGRNSRTNDENWKGFLRIADRLDPSYRD